MIRRLKEFIDLPVYAEDGELGPVRDFYFDDFNWAVRYLAVDIEEGSVLLSPLAFEMGGSDSDGLKVHVTREYVMNSPRFDLDLPVTRIQETELHNYFSWPFYWLAGGLASYPLVDLASEMKDNDSSALEDDPKSQHLRRAGLIFGSHIQARDGEIGSIDDLLIEDEAWNILYLVVDTGAWLPGRKVLLSPSWVEQVDWATGEISMDLSKETIENSPEYDPDVPLDEDYDRRLKDHYRR